MSLDTFNVTRTNQRLKTGDTQALTLEHFNKKLEKGIRKRLVTSGLTGHFDFVRGTGTHTRKAVGGAELQLLIPGVTPNGSSMDFNKLTATIENLVFSRNTIPMIDTFQTDIPYQSAIADEQADKMATFIDNTVLITGLKAAKMTTNPYNIPGWQGGTQVTLPTAQAEDPSAILDAISRLFSAMAEKDVNVQEVGVELYMRPKQFYALLGNDSLINGEFVTAEGTSMGGAGRPMTLKAFGVPVRISTNSPLGTQVTSHLLNTTKNENFYNGDFRNDVILAMAPESIWGLKHTDVVSDMFNDKLSRSDYIDSWTGFTTVVNRPEYAGVISLV